MADRSSRPFISLWSAFVAGVIAVVIAGVALLTAEPAFRSMVTPTTLAYACLGGCGAGSFAHNPVPPPDLGNVDTPEALVALLRTSGPLDNETMAARLAGRASDRSICADIAEHRDTRFTVVYQALAAYQGLRGVLLVLQGADGSQEARIYSTGSADASGGCPLLIAAQL